MSSISDEEAPAPEPVDAKVIDESSNEAPRGVKFACEEPDVSSKEDVKEGTLLADQLCIKSDGSSGYKKGEEDFDEGYYQEWQANLKIELAKKVKEHQELLMNDKKYKFEESYKAFKDLKTRTGLADKFYNPYKLIRQGIAQEREFKNSVKQLEAEQKTKSKILM